MLTRITAAGLAGCLIAGAASGAGETNAAMKPIAIDQPAALAQVRAGLGHTLEKLLAGKPVAIAYFGSSISNSKWGPFNADWFRRAFPDAEIREIKAAIGATGSALGVFRVRDHVLKHHPDLVFVEFSINDDGRPALDIGRDVEGIVRQIWAADPQIDICLVHMYRPGYALALDAGRCTPSQAAHEAVAEYYGIPSINAAARIQEQVDAGSLLLSAPKDADGNPQPTPAGIPVFSIGDGVHPGDDGARIIADAVGESLSVIFAASSPGAHALPPPLIPGNPMERARLAPLAAPMLSSGWVLLDETTNRFGRLFSETSGSQYKMSGVWEAGAPGESIRFRFRGTGVGLYDVRAPDAGQVDVVLDGKPVASPAGLYGFSRVHPDHWPCMLWIADGLEDRDHTVTITLSPDPPDRRTVLEAASKKAGFDPKQFEGTFIRVARILVVGDLIETP